MSIEDNDNIGDESPKVRKTARERFFAIDARSWPKVCELGMPAAVSYLVLACGSGGDQTTTGWSVDAITRHTGIGRPRAKKAIETLEKAGLIKTEKGGTRPRYSIIHAHKRIEEPKPLLEEEQRILDIVAKGNSSVPKVGRRDNVWQWGSPYATALDLVKKGYLRNLGNYRFAILEKQAPPEDPDLIWLPSNLVDSEGKSVTPVERIRQSQNITALRLFIELYHYHDLINEQGINWRTPHGLRFEYERVRLGQRGERVVWGFVPKHSSVWPSAPFCKPYYEPDNKEKPVAKFWDALGILTSLHLIEPIPYLVDSDSEHGEVMWPVSLKEVGEDCEQAVGSAAAELARLMLTSGQLEFADTKEVEFMSPALQHMGEVQAIGIYRLRYRPHTEATRIWLANLTEQCKGTLERFQELIAEFEEPATLSKHATSR